MALSTRLRALFRPSSPALPGTEEWHPDREQTIWGHATSAQRLAALGEIGVRLKSERPELRFVVSVDADVETTSAPDGVDQLLKLPNPESIGQARIFLRQIKASVCLWTGGRLRPSLVKACEENALHMLLLDIRSDEVPDTQRTLFKNKTLTMFEQFGSIFTPSQAAAQKIRAMGISNHQIRLTAPMEQIPTPPRCNYDDLEEMEAQLKGRPVWLAAFADQDEFAAILSAQREATRRLHRLLLIVAVKNEDELAHLSDQIKQAGLICADWATGQLPEENTQVLLAIADDSLGLWYRVAPVTLMADSLLKPMSGHSPLAALSLGSAIVFGPGVSGHADIYERLEEDGAARRLKDPGELSAAIMHLSAPNQAAEMALKGWQIATESAQLTDQIAETMEKWQPSFGEQNARA